MELAFTNFFNFILNEFINPIYNAFVSSNLFKSLFTFFERILSAIFKLWNNDNVLDLSNDLLLKAFVNFLGVLILYFIIKITISMFNLIFNTFRKAI